MALAHRALDAFNRRDLGAYLELVDEDGYEDALERERALRDSAVRDEAARSEIRLSAERDRLGGRVSIANRRAARVAALRRRTIRPVWLAVAGIAGFIVFLIIGLTGGLDAAWAYVVGAGVVLGIAAAVDQLVGRRQPLPELEESDETTATDVAR